MKSGKRGSFFLTGAFTSHTNMRVYYVPYVYLKDRKNKFELWKSPFFELHDQDIYMIYEKLTGIVRTEWIISRWYVYSVFATFTCSKSPPVVIVVEN